MKRSWQRLFTLALSLVLAACEVATSPQEVAERAAVAFMEGKDQDLSALLEPESRFQKLSARKIRIHSQGLDFRAAAKPTSEEANSDGGSRTTWALESSIAGTDRYAQAATLQIVCREEPKRHCLIADFEQHELNFPELSAVPRESLSDDPTPRVWLMTSLDVLDPRINLFSGRNHQVIASIEGLFEEWAREQAPQARPVIAHLANQDDLARVLLDTRTLAVFWVSHGTEGKVIDSQGFELAPVLSAVAPYSGAKRIALVSCNSRGLITGDERVIDFDDKVDLTRGLKEALKKTTSSDLSGELRASRQRAEHAGERVSLVRKMKRFDPLSEHASVIPAIRIETGTEILATLPGSRSVARPGNLEQVQSIEISVPLLTQRLILSSGESYTTPLTEIHLGDWEILSPGWKFFADANGKPIGVTRNIVLKQPKKEN